MTKAKKVELENTDKLILDMKENKYRNLVLAMKWTYHLKNTEEYKDKLPAEIIEKALNDVLSGNVTEKQIMKALEKDEEIRLEKLVERKKEKNKKS